ncbi:methionine--tRNA ligase [Helicobacter muridarum]|uniref:Methionine--tRNA ligase n=1 Tax=Helicobacter muridarum TaxID=216 RepID=A0A099TWR0_9HELI|nr:methionine--tRNA ligase [Helicobacter muridarum]TLD99766.1 methionine--tRNA ligase [Helicobacter muridarum]STQ87002.1 methionyl-tRNA synthetase [Helicobacter muridarum]
MKQLLTTPIYYVNDIPHIGHAYTTIIADVLKKYWNLQGNDIFLLTGTDEHGQKIEGAAKKKNMDIGQYVDSIAKRFQDTWDCFGIDYDKFIRTTFVEHKISVQKAFEIMFDKGDIYKGEYEGRYCVSCESFFTQTQVFDEIYCPDCGKETQIVKEESYFFALSKYQDRLLTWYRDNAKCILPLHKKNEVIAFVEQGLQDLSITRTSFKWGIPIPEKLHDEKHIIYVWLDALISYISALGYGLTQSNAKEILQNHLDQDPCLNSNMQYFEHATHIVGKDILRFHAIYWPAFLMSLDVPLPKHIFVHGWWTINGVKMSKSLGNVVNPLEIQQAYPMDIFRYFLLKEVPFGQDGDFSQTALINRNNGELSNDLGNLLNRLQGMSEKYFNFELKESFCRNSYHDQLEKINSITTECHVYIENMQLNKYLESVWELLYLGNEMITKVAPWELMKSNKNKECKEFLNLIANILAKAGLLLYPVMPNSCEKIARCLGFAINPANFTYLISQQGYLQDFVLTKVEALFPKIESKRIESKNADSSNNLESDILDSNNVTINQNDDSSNNQLKPHTSLNSVSIDDFSKIEIRVGTILDANRLPKSHKLLKLKVDIGDTIERQIIAGIAEYYDSKDLIGKQVCVIVNLKPAKIMSEISEGMLLVAKDSNGLSIINPEQKRENGSKIS